MNGQAPKTKRYEQIKTLDSDKTDKLLLVASNRKIDNAIHLHQKIEMYVAKVSKNEKIEFVSRNSNKIYLHNIKGELSVNSYRLKEGDAAKIENKEKIIINADSDSHLILFDF